MRNDETIVSWIKWVTVGLVALVMVLEMAFLGWAYTDEVQRERSEARVVGEKIAAAFQAELNRCVDSTELLEDLYSAYGQSFLNDFDIVCAELAEDNLAIGSLYFAPNGVIKYAYPDEVDEATSNFEMLKDPIQGPKAQLALDTGKTTVAGPHELIEGGLGFIIRNPIYKEDGSFDAFAITVIDEETFIQQAMDRLSEGEKSYNFAVWKTPDETAVVGDDGYIFKSADVSFDKSVQVTFNVPNDIWYLTLEPAAGWMIFQRMLARVFVSLIIALLLVVLVLVSSQYLIRRRRLALALGANQAKSAFLFNMSHDIRTPMNAIIGFTDLMEKNIDDKEKLQEYLEKVKSSNELLLSLINNVLEMARIESGEAVLDLNRVSVPSVREGLLAVFEDQARSKSISLDCDIDVQHPFIYADEMKVKEIYLNLLSNAIKYTPEGGTVHTAIREIPSSGPGRVRLESVIEDTGIGMSADYLPHLYDEFTRERTSTQSKIAGTGLGMPIVKKLVDLMGGTIQCESELGKGTRFTVIMEHDIAPIPISDGDVQDKREADCDFTGKRVLLTEDNELNAEIAIAVLEGLGFIVEHAEDGIECVDMLRKAPSGYFDLVLMDIQMPRMDGHKATAAIRAFDDEKADIPIIAMTANAFEEDRQAALNAGMNGFVTKPIDIDLLVEALAEAIG